MSKIVLTIFFICLSIRLCSPNPNGVKILYKDEKHKISDEKFHPTKEWQTVKEDQAIPSGLHVRLNLETGEKEAKLLEENDSKENSDNLIAISNENPSITDEVYLKNLLKEKKLRSMDELKKDFEKVNADYRTDAEILSSLMKEYKISKNKDTHLHILQDLENYLHQVDNGQEWLRLGGIPMLINDINSTDHDIAKAAAICLAGAVQSNPKVQVKTIHHLPILLKRLETISNEDISLKVLYATSALVRNIPVGLTVFIEKGGLEVLEQILSMHESTKLKVKVVTFIYDMITESENYKNEERPNISKLYNDVLSSIKERNWCQYFWDLLDVNGHDSKEKIIKSLDILKCSTKNLIYKSHLLKLRDEYRILAENDKDDDGYFSSLQELFDKVFNFQTRVEL